MKSLRIAGLCLVAMFVMSMVAAGTASAEPTVFESCQEGAAGTKYEENLCEKASGTGKFAIAEIKGTESAIGIGSLRLADTKVPIVGTVEVSCTGETKGTVGPGKFARVEKIENINCTPGTNCEKIEKNPEPRNLPWQNEIAEGGARAKITATNGKGAGWAVTCKVLGITKTDECTTEEGSVSKTRVRSPGFFTGAKRWLLLFDFETSSANAKCTIGGANSGRVRGTVAVLRFSIVGGKFEDLNLL